MSWLKRIKGVYFINNLLHKKTLSCNESIYEKFGLKKATTDLISSKDLENLEIKNTPWLDQKNIPDNFEMLLQEQNFDTKIEEQIRAWHNRGYLILNQAYSSDEIDIILDEIEHLEKSHKAKHRLDERIIFAIHHSEKIYELATKKGIVQILNFLLGRKVKLFQSLNFSKGSAQKAHSDTIHMTTYPLGYLIAVWIALEDIKADSGPLFYYPGSHQLPYVLNKDYDHGGNYFLLGKEAYKKYENAIAEVIQKNNLQKEIFLAKKGDAFIWHANILHGGEPIQNPLSTRKSMVLHFYAEDVICYHEITQRPAIFNGKEAHCPPAILK